MMHRTHVTAACAALLIAGLSVAGLTAQAGAGKEGEWRTYGRRHTREHALFTDSIRIDRTNFSKLEIASRSKTDILGARPDFNLQTTPLMIKGVLYATAGSRRDAVAIDARTGELLWMYRLDEGRRATASPRPLSGRGVAYWTDGRNDERIFFVTIGYQLVALNAKNGQPVPGFGQNGVVEEVLKERDDQILRIR
ncbi:MAG: PQQ-binding-like beta-propeller repeat protein [Vicinamibacterales bacterium]